MTDKAKPVALTASVMTRLRTTGERYAIWDTELSGFGVRVGAGGKRTCVLRYRPGAGGRTTPLRQVTVGTWPELTVEQARRKAHALAAQAQLGGDPMADRTAEREARTVADVCAHYSCDYARHARLRPRTVKGIEGAFRLHVLPDLGRTRAKDVTTARVRELHRATADRAGVYQANRVLAYLSKAFTLAVENGWTETNPVEGVRRFPEDRRERFLSDDEVGRFLRACDQLPDPRAADALRLLLLTGARLREVTGASFDQFDLEAGVWTKPSAHTKQKREHRAALSPEALSIVRGLRAADPFGRYLFPGRTPDAPRVDLNKPWQAVCARAGLEGVRIHDLRHTLASSLASAGVGLPVIGRALGHTQAATTHRYAHVAERAQADAVALAGARFAQLHARPAAPVAPIRRRPTEG